MVKNKDSLKLVAECAFDGKWGVIQNFDLSRALLSSLDESELDCGNLQCMLAFMYIKGLGGCFRRADGFKMLEGACTAQSARLLQDFDSGAMHWGANPAEVRQEEHRRMTEKRREELIPPLQAPRRQRVDSADFVA